MKNTQDKKYSVLSNVIFYFKIWIKVYPRFIPLILLAVPSGIALVYTEITIPKLIIHGIEVKMSIYKNGNFIVLDVRTASLDPISEYEIYSQFDNIIGSDTAIYISHRLSSCRFCDNIYVLSKGELVQSGSHNQLISDINGEYYELWNEQAKYYKRD